MYEWNNLNDVDYWYCLLCLWIHCSFCYLSKVLINQLMSNGKPQKSSSMVSLLLLNRPALIVTCMNYNVPKVDWIRFCNSIWDSLFFTTYMSDHYNHKKFVAVSTNSFMEWLHWSYICDKCKTSDKSLASLISLLSLLSNFIWINTSMKKTCKKIKRNFNK